MNDETRKAAYDFLASDLFRDLVGSPAFLQRAHAFEARIESGELITVREGAEMGGPAAERLPRAVRRRARRS